MFNIPEVQFYYKFDLSMAVTSLQQPLSCCPMGGCCREVALQFEFNFTLTLLYSERPKLYGVLTVLSATG